MVGDLPDDGFSRTAGEIDCGEHDDAIVMLGVYPQAYSHAHFSALV